MSFDLITEPDSSIDLDLTGYDHHPALLPCWDANQKAWALLMDGQDESVILAHVETLPAAFAFSGINLHAEA